MRKPLVSIVVPVYNTAPYLRRCIDSILDLKHPLEVIIIDDGSTDGSSGIIEMMCASDARIHVISQENRGLSAARNAGLDLARGTFVGFVDSDDWINPDEYCQLIERAIETRADVTVARHTHYYQRRSIYRDERCAQLPSNIQHSQVLSGLELSYRIMRINAAAWDKLFLRRFIERERLSFPEGRVFEEVSFVYRALIRSDRIAFIDTSVYYYRKERSDAITNNRSLLLFDIFEVIDNLKRDVLVTDDHVLMADLDRYAIEFYLRNYWLADRAYRATFYTMMRAQVQRMNTPKVNPFIDERLQMRIQLMNEHVHRRFRSKAIVLASRERMNDVVGVIGARLYQASPAIHKFAKRIVNLKRDSGEVMP